MTARTPFTPDHPAAERQRRASDPRRSTWLSANAGSGKTRVLTDRVARLLLAGADPQTILCLTYTKAAAAEMQARLFRSLGGWSMRPDRELGQELAALGLTEGLRDVDLARARRLFAQALETPGGLRIQTIHAFCAGLLRRFPLEAGVSPQFRELDDRGAERLRAEVAEEMATGPHAPLIDALARELTGEALEALLGEVAGRRQSLAAPCPDADLRGHLGLGPDACAASLLACIAAEPRRRLLADLRDLCLTGSAKDLEAAAALGPVCAAPRLGLAELAAVEGVLLFKSGEKAFAAKLGAFPTQKLRKAAPALVEAVEGLMREVEAGRDQRLALSALARTRTLHAFAQAFVPLYEARKLARGVLDFDDLIGRALALLSDPAVAPWILYRLDGGIDHILVDEAQDTSPAQWAVIERLADEFAAGQGAGPERERTIFVVGDRKQSIFSFQGADAEGFSRQREHFAERLSRVRKTLEPHALEHSFRSAPAVLAAVDHTFAGEAAEGLGEAAPRHLAVHEAKPGRVDLWPPVPPPPRERAAPPPWTEPADGTLPRHPARELAKRVGEGVERMLREGSVPARADDGWRRRPVRPGDVLILLRRRKELFQAIIRELKARGLEVAGADRLRLGAELAVRDVEATLRVLALPDDSLALACALRSPLFGWDEARLYALAQPRPEGQPLWDALRRGPPCEALEILQDLRRQADFLRPYEVISRLLVRHDGRRRLLARLGAEAEDGIDALMSQALAYERASVPSLTGFLEWRGGGDVEVKRQLDAAGDRIRVMTVHGAKGLEAPIVILPDCAKPSRPPSLSRLYPMGGTVLWAPNRPEMPRALLARQRDLLDADARERRRLLYVAMTRAESWLVVAAAGETGAGGESWHALVRDGLGRLGAREHDFAQGPGAPPGLRHDPTPWEGLPPLAAAPAPAGGVAATGPALGPVPRPGPRPAPLSPSDLGGAKVVSLPPASVAGGTTVDDDLGARARAEGRLLHLALEHLPLLPGEAGEARVLGLLLAAADAEGVVGLDPKTVLAEARALVAAPALAPLWAPGALAEAALTAEVPPLGRLHGTVDRLLVGPDAVTAVDFKTNRLVPATPQAVPEGILRQMGAYAAMLGALYPGRAVRTQVLWTRTAALMDLPPALVMAALSRAEGPADGHLDAS